MKRPNNITTKLKIMDAEIVAYVKEMEKENLKLHNEIARMQVNNVSQQNEIAALKKRQPKVKVVMNIGKKTNEK